MAGKGKVEVEITANDQASAKLTAIGSKCEQMGQKFSKAGKVMIGIAAGITTAIGGTLVAYAKAGDEIDKMSKRTGFAAEALSELRYACQITGASIGDIEKSLKKMSTAVVNADRGLETYVRTFRELGLDITELRNMQPEEAFFKIAGAVGELENEMQQAAIAQEIFGRAGTTLLPFIKEGTEGIERLREEAHELGLVFDEEAAAKAAALQDAMTRLKGSLQGVGIMFADSLVPIVTDFAENTLLPMITHIKDWISQNSGLAETLLKVAGVMAVGGALLMGLSYVAKAITAINTALVIMHALSGVAGWIKLAAGIAIAGGAIYSINKLMEGFGGGAAEEHVPGYEAAVAATEARAKEPKETTEEFVKRKMEEYEAHQQAQEALEKDTELREDEANLLERANELREEENRKKELEEAKRLLYGEPALSKEEQLLKQAEELRAEERRKKELEEAKEYLKSKGIKVSMAGGGRVPGAIGEPVPIMAHGGEELSGLGRNFGGNVYIGSFMGDETSLRAFTRKMRDIMNKDMRRTSFPSINRLEYFPGSSAP